MHTRRFDDGMQTPLTASPFAFLGTQPTMSGIIRAPPDLRQAGSTATRAESLMPYINQEGLLMRPSGHRRKRGGRRSFLVLVSVLAVCAALGVGVFTAARATGRRLDADSVPAVARAIAQAADTLTPGPSHSARAHRSRRHHHHSEGSPSPSASASASATPSSAPPSSPPSGETGSCTTSNAVFAVGSRSWPNCTNTGAPAGVQLKNLNSPNPTGAGTSDVTNITKSGTVIDGVNLSGSIDVWANDVTIENSVINARSWWGINLRAGYTGLKVLHDTIVGVPGQGPDNGAEDYGVSSSGGTVEVGWSDVSQFGDAISLGTGNIHDNYVHNLVSFIPAGSSSYNHDDALISDGGSGLTVVHNTMLDQFTPQKGASASIGLFDDDGPVTNVTVSDNYIAGGAYALYPGGGGSSRNLTITDNVFSTIYWSGSGFYGPVASSYWHSGSGNTWSGNTWADGSGKAINP